MVSSSAPPPLPALSDVQMVWLQKNRDMAGGSTAAAPATSASATSARAATGVVSRSSGGAAGASAAPPNASNAATTASSPGPAVNQPRPLSDDEKAKLDKKMNAYRAAVRTMADAGIDTGPYDAETKTFQLYYVGVARFSNRKDRERYLDAVLDRIDDATDAAKSDAKHVDESAVEGTDGAIRRMLDGTKDAIKKVKDKDVVESLMQRMSDLEGLFEKQSKEKSRKERGKLLKQLNVQAESLFDAAVDAARDPETDKKAQNVYAEALEKRYGLKIKNPDKIANTHLDQVYKMFDMVPATDVAHGSLKKLEYQATTEETGPDGKTKKVPWDGAAFSSDGGEIDMGDIAKGESVPYYDPATGVALDPRPNWFNMATLHELGHSVDDRFKVMKVHAVHPSCGGWKSEKLADVATAYIDDFHAREGKTVTIDEKALRRFVEKALESGKLERPRGVDENGWKTLGPQLAALGARCASRRSNAPAWPWKFPYDIGGRAYHEAYPDEWWSFVTAARSGMTVRDYQWRAPGEWFAELYAYTWLNSKPAPGSLDTDLTGYFYGGGKAAATPPANR